MGLQAFLDKKHISKYHLSKVSGVPKTTIMDICAGRSEIERCSAKTVQLLAKALDCSMEDLMELSDPYDSQTGLPKDKSYLECGSQSGDQPGPGMVSEGEIFSFGESLICIQAGKAG